jgi:hypothetical protein
MNSTSTKNNQGFVTLTISLILLIAVTLISMFSVKSISLENKIANNSYRSDIALQAAEASVASAFNYLSVDPDVDGDNAIDSVFDIDGDGIGDNNEMDISSARAVVTVDDMSGGEMTLMQIRSTGFSDDNSARRVISMMVANVDPLPNAPDNPMTTRGAVVINGSATVHNPEGHSTIWSGNDIDMGSNNSTSTNVADPGDAGYPVCMDTPMTCGTVSSSNKLTAGLDIIEHDSSLGALTPEEMFINFFGMDPVTYRDSMISIDSTPGTVNDDAHLANYEVIWVEGDASISNITMGCTSAQNGANVCPVAQTKPSVLIINGDLELSGTAQFYGIVFVMGSLDASANATIHGAVISAGDLLNSAGGSLDVWYNSDILADLDRAGPLTGVAGSWRDI